MAENPAQVDRTQFIAAMRGVASSVSVVTTDGPAGRHGATVSAFCSVSADPPTVLVCLHAHSRTARLVEENGVFALNVLPENAGEVADRFAGAHDDRVSDRFEGIDIDSSAVPGITGATALECKVSQSVLAGSHRIFIGDVQTIAGEGKQPLTYLDGGYHQVTPLKKPGDNADG